MANKGRQFGGKDLELLSLPAGRLFSLVVWYGPSVATFPVLTTSSVSFSYLNPPPTPSAPPHLPSHLPPCYAGPKLMHTRKNCQKALKFSHQLFITLFIYKTIDNQVLLWLTNTATTKLRAGSCKWTFKRVFLEILLSANYAGFCSDSHIFDFILQCLKNFNSSRKLF